MELEIKNEKFGLIATCPISKNMHLFASGATTINKDHDPFLKIFLFDTTDKQDPIKLLSNIKVSSYFTSFTWGKFGEETKELSLGIIAGGHIDGSVSIWNVSQLLSDAAKEAKGKMNFGCISMKKFHDGQVNDLKFNPFKSNLLATCGRDIYVHNIDKLSLNDPLKCSNTQIDSVMTSLNWNDKVQYILASATSNGRVFVWDMRKQAATVQIYDQFSHNDTQRHVKTTVMWYPENPVQLVIAYDDPEMNYLHLYDIRQPTAPCGEFYGSPSRSIFEFSSNPNDNSLLLAAGRDNIIACWNMKTQKCVTSITLPYKIIQAIWFPKIPDIFFGTTANGTLFIEQINLSPESTSNDADFAPKWLQKKCGANFGFGGNLIVYSDKLQNGFNIHKINGREELENQIKGYIEKVESFDKLPLLEEKITNSENQYKRLMWSSLKYLVVKNSNELFKTMGYDKTKLQTDVYTYLGKQPIRDHSVQRVIPKKVVENEFKDFEKVFDDLISNKKLDVPKQEEKQEERTPMTLTETISKNINWNLGSEKLIKDSLLIGDLDNAVEVAMKCGRDAEALLIASNGSKELFLKAKNLFFSKNKDLFIKNIFSSIIKQDFEQLLEYNIIKDWKEYVLYALTYLAKSDFGKFANSMGEKLASCQEFTSALICFVLGENYERCVNILYENYLKEIETVTKQEKEILLQKLFEEVLAMKYIMDFNSRNEQTDNIFMIYCEMLISLNLAEQAYSYLIKINSSNSKVHVMTDRIYGLCDDKLVKKNYKRPLFPFDVINVKNRIVKETKIQQQPQSNTSNINNNQSLKKTLDTSKNNPFSNLNQTPSQNAFSNTTPNNNQSNFNHPPVTQIPSKVENKKGPFGQLPLPGKTEEKPNNQLNKLDNKPPLMKTFPKTNPVNDFPTNSTEVQEKQIVKNPPVSTISKPPAMTYNNRAVAASTQPFDITKNAPVPKKPDSPFTNKNVNNQSQQVQEDTSSQVILSKEEQFILEGFEGLAKRFCTFETNQKKQEELLNKMEHLFNKLKKHEINTNLQRLLKDFIENYENSNQQQLKKYQLQIQGIGWDQNKVWMSAIDKFILMKK